MSRSTKDAWLSGPGDLKTAEVADVPTPGESVLVTGLAAAYSNEAQSKATKLVTTPQGDQVATLDTGKMSVLQFAHGVVEPKFSVAEAEVVAQRFGPAFHKVISKIDELSGVDKQALEEAQTRFPAGGASANGAELGDAARPGDGRPDVPARTGA